jgi:excisionase family DNA binding protein
MTILTPQEAATFLKCTVRTLQRHKEIPRTKVGGRDRFILEDLQNWLRRQSGASTRLVVHRNPLYGAR